MLETNLALVRRLGNPVEIAATLSTLAMARLQGGDAKAAMDSELEALQIFGEIGHRDGELVGHLHLGQCAAYLADDAQARDSLERGLALAREMGQQEIEAECGFELGALALEAGEAAAARRWLLESLRVSHISGNKRGEACALWGLGRVDLLAGDTAAARPRLAAALQAFRDFEMREQMLGCLESLAQLAWLEQAAGDAGAGSRAAALAAAVAQMRARWSLGRSPRAEERWQDRLRALQGAVDVDMSEAIGPGAKVWSMDEATEFALAASMPGR